MQASEWQTVFRYKTFLPEKSNAHFQCVAGGSPERWASSGRRVPPSHQSSVMTRRPVTTTTLHKTLPCGCWKELALHVRNPHPLSRGTPYWASEKITSFQQTLMVQH